MAGNRSVAQGFVDHWVRAEASERANAQSFLIGLARLLEVPEPSHSHADGYSFEFPVRIPTGPSTFTEGRIDLYRRGSFVLEAKQFAGPKQALEGLLALGEEVTGYTARKKAGPVRGSMAWDDAMWKARGQAERYALSLPASEPSAPFLLVVDVGHTIEIYADFTQAGRSYQPWPDPRRFRIRMDNLLDEEVRGWLRAIWLAPLTLDPARVSAAVTREIAGYLAVLAGSLEEAGHNPRNVAEFLTRVLFCMFAEDVGLLPKDSFRELLEGLRDTPEGFAPKLRTLFTEMQKGTEFSVILNRKLLRFNGGLFEDASVLPLDARQLGVLIKASQMEWKDVEPAIFGTLLERALDPAERHSLGAHYTPRAYVERLVLPTVIEPLRGEWEKVRTAALVHARADRLSAARSEIAGFHDRLCTLTVLDPACGSGNFLYVTLEHLKRLEGEVLDAASDLGENLLLDLSTHSVDPHQFLGLEINPRAAALAELVLWIGYLQWHFRTRGQSLPSEPVLKKFRNIECRDAVLAWDGEREPRRDSHGNVVTVWDRRSFKSDSVTGRKVPDESRRVPLYDYPNARPASWPKADYIVGNPPFLGTKRMRESLGDGYVEALRAAYSERVEDNADFVMYWWNKAADLLGQGKLTRFGLITTNSLRQEFNRRVVQQFLDRVSIVFAIPDHPWVDTKDGAAVRIAMTVCQPGNIRGELQRVQSESPSEDGSSTVTFAVEKGRIAADLSVGADLSMLRPLQAAEGICGLGVALHGSGFILEPEEAARIRAEGPAVIKPYMGGKDLLHSTRERYLIDFSFMTEEQARLANPRAFQHVIDHVRPERVVNRRAAISKLWWRYGWERPEIRRAMRGLRRYIGTTETSKHRVFQFIEGSILPDHMVIVIASDDAFHLGVLSSNVHKVFSLAAGGTLEDRPRYNKTRCFDPFPFPACNEDQRSRIRSLGEQIDSHRKRVQALHPGLALTGVYNVLECLRAGTPLTAKDQAIHDQGLVSVLRQLHEELDSTVADAYGWGDLNDAWSHARLGQLTDFRSGLRTAHDPSTPAFRTAWAGWEREYEKEVLLRLVALNMERSSEESRGLVRWLRPETQLHGVMASQSALSIAPREPGRGKSLEGRKTTQPKQSWPKALPDRVGGVEGALKQLGTPATVTQVAACFRRADVAAVREILDTLVALGRIHREGDRYRG